MDNCSRHKSHIEHYSNHKELAEAIGDLRYDSLIELFEELSFKFQIDADADYGRGRKRLSKKLADVALRFHEQQMDMKEIWEICEPYMK